MASEHLSDTELTRLALDGRDHPHVGGCPVCAAELEQLRVVVERLRALPDPPPRLLEAARTFFRRRRALEGLLERLADDPAFRARAEAKPEQVLREAGLDPVPELIEVLRQTGRTPGDVAKRIAAKHLWL